MRVYTCDICGKQAIGNKHEELQHTHYGGNVKIIVDNPKGWKHVGGRKGTTVCAHCYKELKGWKIPKTGELSDK